MGSSEALVDHPATSAVRRIALPDAVLTPAFANAHSHLDLSTLGTIEAPAGGFVGWIERVRDARAATLDVARAIRHSVALGARMSLSGGVVAVGDIAGAANIVAVDALAESALLGVSFLEVFGLGDRRHAALERMRSAIVDRERGDLRIRVGVQPHAPYSAGADVYRAAADLAREHSVPVATHLAESAAERLLVAHNMGPLRAFLERIGIWSPTNARDFGAGRSPVAHAIDALAGCPRSSILCAHCNDVDDEDIKRLAAAGASVVYCPRSTAFLKHADDLRPHAWRAMLDAGVLVALGTDSVASLPGFQPVREDAWEAVHVQPLTPLDDARALWRLGERDAHVLLRMITQSPAVMLGLQPEWFEFRAGELVAGVVAITAPASPSVHDDPLASVFAGNSPPLLLSPGELL